MVLEAMQQEVVHVPIMVVFSVGYMVMVLVDLNNKSIQLCEAVYT
jgi:hypothetical protein